MSVQDRHETTVILETDMAGDPLLYDRSNDRAWLQSSVAVELDRVR